MSPFVSLRLTQANTPHCSHIGPLAPAPSGLVVRRKKPGFSPEDSDQLLCDEGLEDANPSGQWFTCCHHSRLMVMCMDHLAGLIEAHLIICQQVNAENFSDRRNAAAICSHVHSCSYCK